MIIQQKFHKFADGLKAINTIWHLTNEQGIRVSSYQKLASLGTSHFKKLYKAPPNASLAEIIRVDQLFQRFVDQEEELEHNK